MNKLTKRHLIYVRSEQTMNEVVATMIQHNISSVLVLNSERFVVGIVTERDIVQKFTLLEQKEKLQAKVAAFMTRPVLFARLLHLEDDVREMFFQKRLRHFPVHAGSNHEKDIVGLLTVTDMTQSYLKSSRSVKKDLTQEAVVIVSRDVEMRKRYRLLFEALNFHVITGSDIDLLMQQAERAEHPIVFDVDDLELDEAKKDLIRLKQHRGVFVVLSSQPALVEPLKKLLDSELHCVALKPLDISYILLLLERLHQVPAG